MSDWTDRERTLLRAGLFSLAVVPAWIGIWATAAPRGFFDTFPGAGHHWVNPLGPYDEHLMRDYAAANLGFLVLLVFAGVVLDRRLVQGALAAFAVAGIPHLAFHLTETGPLSTADNIVSLAGLVSLVAGPLGLLALTVRRRPAAVAR